MPNRHNWCMIIRNWFDWPPFSCLAMCSLQKGGQSNQLQIIMHQLCWLGIKQVVYLACSKCTALVKLVQLHASIVCSLVAFLASHWYHTFQSFTKFTMYVKNIVKILVLLHISESQSQYTDKYVVVLAACGTWSLKVA